MPRHTRPRPAAKHSRAHIREQRDRKIESRFRAAKRAGRLDRLSLEGPVTYGRRGQLPSVVERRQRIEAEIAAFRVTHGYPPEDTTRWGGNFLHPELLRYLPSGLRAQLAYLPLEAGGSLNGLADRDTSQLGGCRCEWCCPEMEPGRRTREKARWRQQAREGVEDWEDLEPVEPVEAEPTQ